MNLFPWRLILTAVTIYLAGISFPGAISAQVTVIEGVVLDSITHDPIPFANVIITNSGQGTVTDFNGSYRLELHRPSSNSLTASLIGYRPQTLPVTIGKVQTINFELVPHNEDLPEVVITYEGNPADAIVDSIIKYKERSTFQSYQYRQYESYTKAMLGVNNVSEEVFERKLMEPFDFIADYKDTSQIDGRLFTPVMISETRSKIYERKSPESKREIITATRVSGLEHANISQFVGNLILEVNIYDNHIEMFEKNFVSPISDHGHDYYKYYLVDSAFVAGKWCYKLDFKPRRKQELCFLGSLWVNDTSYAIADIYLKLAEDANLNFVNKFIIEQQFRWTENAYWLPTKDKLIADFNLVKNSNTVVGAYGERTNYFSSYVFDTIDKPGIFKMNTEARIEEDALKLDDKYWEEVRPESLSEAEAGIYQMVDSVKNTPQFKKYKTIATGIASGYFAFGKVELGPYFKLFSYNSIEGFRFRVGGRTTQKMSKKIRIGGYVAYGTKDDRFKYGADLIYLFNKNPRRALNASFKYDMEQLGLSPTGRPTDNLLSSFFSRGPIDKLTMVREYKLSYEYEWFNGLINTVHFNRRELYPPPGSEFLLYPESPLDTVQKNSITTTELGLDTRISFKERYIDGMYNRMTIRSDYPIILISYRYGIPHAKVNDYNYHKLNIGIQQWFNVGTIGWSRFYIDFGKIWGTLPYPLLKIHNGNETWLFDEFSNNLMNYYEFVSDHYVALYYTHHFDGLLFNKIPLVRRLGLREVVHFRGLYGNVREENLNFSDYPGSLRPIGNEPYLEAGVGIENIIKFFRVDAIWRLTHLDDPGNEPVSKFGVFASLYFSF